MFVRKDQVQSAMLPVTAKQLDRAKLHSFNEQISKNIIQPQHNHLIFSATFRQARHLSLIKSNFQRILQLQNINLLERAQFNKQREAVLKQQEEKAKITAGRVKGEQIHKGQSIRNWRNHKMNEGVNARKCKLQNDFVRLKEETNDLKAKKLLIKDRHHSMRARKANESKDEYSPWRHIKANQQYYTGLIREISLKMCPKPKANYTYKRHEKMNRSLNLPPEGFFDPAERSLIMSNDLFQC